MGAEGKLPQGAALHELTSVGDHRGLVVELDRMSWHPDDWREDSPWMRMFRNARRWIG